MVRSQLDARVNFVKRENYVDEISYKIIFDVILILSHKRLYLNSTNRGSESEKEV